MKGIELTLNGKIYKASIKNGVISAIISRIKIGKRNLFSLDLSGYNPKTEEYPRWLYQNLYLGDEILVKIKDIDQNSPEIIKNDEENSFQHSENEGVELNFKNETFSAKISEGSISLIISVLKRDGVYELELDFLSGETSEKEKGKRRWLQRKFDFGDEFLIKIKEISENNIPFNSL